MSKEQILSFDEKVDTYIKMLNNQAKFTGYHYEYFQKYRVDDLKNEAEQHLSKCDKLKILDFGCGMGLVISFMSEIFKDAEIYGCDISEKSLEICKQTYSDKSNIHIEKITNNKMPFNEKFDIIYISNVFRYIPRNMHAETLKILRASLAENGIIMMYELNTFNPLSLYYHISENILYKENIKSMSASYSKKLFMGADFKFVDLKYRFFIPKFLQPLIFTEKYCTKIPLGASYYIIAK